ncbi:MAG: DUF2117 domain-containing protein [Candidatus Verstraetearchaeota archaeon]|nr:DUF2117 domain-containing protein [Candidatus Verstraetearchaeota archaeon]
MRVGVIFHRPEVIDSDWARKILQILGGFGTVDARLSGTMGTLAVLDSSMDDKIKCDFRPTSQCLAEMVRECDSIVMAMYSDNPLKSHAFCWHLVKKLNCPNIPIVEVEAKNGVVIDWCAKSDLSAKLVKKLGFKSTPPPDYGKTEWIKDGIKYRKVLAAEPGDFVLVNGTVVGRATSEEVILRESDGKIVGGDSVEFKEQGLIKLIRRGKIDLFKVKLDTTTSLRRTEFKRRYHVPTPKGDLIAFIEHDVASRSGATVYGGIRRGITGAVTIGDDTTAIAGEILSRYRIPIIGIVDGDKDGLLKDTALAEGSIILTVKMDDQLGEVIRDKLFKGKRLVNFKFKEAKERAVDLAVESNQLIRREDS